VHSVPSLARLLDMPPEFTPIGVITVGYRAPDRRSSSLKRGRKARDQVLHLDRWAGS